MTNLSAIKKNQNRTLLVLLLLCTTIFFNCTKKSQTAAVALPDITATGANTMGVIVDGQIWLPSTSYGLSTKSLCTQLDAGNGFYLYLAHDHSGSQYTGGDILQINYKPITPVGTYDLTDSNKSQILTIVENVDGYDNFLITKGTLNITRLDLNNKIISGQFSFTAVNKRTNTTHTVTDGRFDLQLNYCQ